MAYLSLEVDEEYTVADFIQTLKAIKRTYGKSTIIRFNAGYNNVLLEVIRLGMDDAV